MRKRYKGFSRMISAILSLVMVLQLLPVQVLGLVSASTGIGGSIFCIFLNKIIGLYGWRFPVVIVSQFAHDVTRLLVENICDFATGAVSDSHGIYLISQLLSRRRVVKRRSLRGLTAKFAY